MNLTIRGKILVSKVLDIVAFLAIVYTLLIAPIFRMEWQEEDEYTREVYIMSIEYSVKDYYFEDTVQAHIENADEFTEAFLGVETFYFKQIKSFKKALTRFEILMLVIMVIMFYLFIIRPSTKKGKSGREKYYIGKGKDPNMEEELENLVNIENATDVVAQSVFFFLLLIPYRISITSLQFFKFIIQDKGLSNLLKSKINIFSVINERCLFSGILVFTILFICSAVIQSSAKKEIRKYKIFNRKEIVSLPCIGRTEDYISVRENRDNSSKKD